ncbi:hypothetical protein SEPCBS57363_005815 [Sporothrix epigloea]|uniref:Chromo domain-containing protein n=1 Tax=Sporothrix epigloea TaxID=1892477 RepID=A0ABP0E3T2_9PEZI
MPLTFSDDESSGASGAGTIGTPSLAKRGKKKTSYADASENSDENGESDGLNKPINGSVLAAKKGELVAKELDEDGEDEGDDGADKDKNDDKDYQDDNDDNDEKDVDDDKSDKDNKDENDEDDKDKDDEDDVEDADEIAEDEYEVGSILSHMLDENGEPRFRVVWKGYDNPSDHTWEPEDNLKDNASEILSEYITKIGGRAKLFEKPAKGRKRGRQSTSSNPATATATKRSRKSASNLPSRKSPVRVQQVFIPPSGSWEDGVTDVEMFRSDEGDLRVFLTWKDGSKSQHAAQEAYTRCPQKILHFYESRISFKAP